MCPPTPLWAHPGPVSPLHTCIPCTHTCVRARVVAYLRGIDSTASLSFLMSHHSTLPSVDTVIASLPVLDCSQATSYTGSLRIHTPAASNKGACIECVVKWSAQTKCLCAPFLQKLWAPALRACVHCIYVCREIDKGDQGGLRKREGGQTELGRCTCGTHPWALLLQAPTRGACQTAQTAHCIALSRQGWHP